jgi:transposase
VWRSYLRQRRMLVAMASRTVQHMQKALEPMHRKLTEVVSAITGKTGMTILRAILAGDRAPQRLATYRDKRCKHDHATIAKALEGHWHAEPLLALQQAVSSMMFLRSSYGRVMDTSKGVCKRLCRTWRPARPRLRRRAHGAQAAATLWALRCTPLSRR